MWLARAKEDNLLVLFKLKPTYDKENDTWVQPKNEMGQIVDTMAITVDPNVYPNVTFENSPIEVFILTNDEKQEEFNKGVRFATDIAKRMMM